MSLPLDFRADDVESFSEVTGNNKHPIGIIVNFKDRTHRIFEGDEAVQALAALLWNRRPRDTSVD